MGVLPEVLWAPLVEGSWWGLGCASLVFPLTRHWGDPGPSKAKHQYLLC